MTIYTSYFANGRALSEAGIMMVGVTRSPPKWFAGPNMRNVAPSASLLGAYKAGRVTEDEYTKTYAKEMETADLEDFVNEVKRLSCGRDAALCCYEKPDAFCHRHILADMIEAKLGITVREYGQDSHADALF